MEFADIKELFSVFGPVDVRRMFGGAGIYADGLMFALLSSKGTIYLRVDDSNEDDFLREHLPPFAPMMKSGKHAVMPYRQMPERLYDEPDELARWAAKALGAAANAAARKAGGKPEARVTRTKTARKKTKRG